MIANKSAYPRDQRTFGSYPAEQQMNHLWAAGSTPAMLPLSDAQHNLGGSGVASAVDAKQTPVCIG